MNKMWVIIAGSGSLVLIILLIGIRFFMQSQPVGRSATQTATERNIQQQISNASSVEERISVLEEAILDLASQVGSIKTMVETGSTTTTSSTNRVSSLGNITVLERQITDLQQQITQLKSPFPISTTQSTTESKSAVYIPLGMNTEGMMTNKDWAGVDTLLVSLDPSDFPGYVSIQLEVTMKLSAIAGTGYAQLFNVSDNSAVSSTQVSMSADKYTLVSSGKGKLANGTKTYQLQVKTSEGYPIYIGTAKIKVNF